MFAHQRAITRAVHVDTCALEHSGHEHPDPVQRGIEALDEHLSSSSDTSLSRRGPLGLGSEAMTGVQVCGRSQAAPVDALRTRTDPFESC
ncbi:MAG: hypothetical protein M3003_16270 [Candidatus Dormibacteraeota bacterium]|nr:hypothetical protein [Candidatus Dormibacteraeota bacterium]